MNNGNIGLGLGMLNTDGLDKAGLSMASPPELALLKFPDDRPKGDGRRAIAGIVLDQGVVASRVQLDRPVVGYAKVWRQAAAVLSAIGYHTDEPLPSVQVGPNTLRVTIAPGDAPPSLGFVLAWGTGWNVSHAFNLSFQTQNFINLGGLGKPNVATPTDRKGTIFACAMPAGGQIFVPWARFQTPSMVIGMPCISVPQIGDVAPSGIIEITNIPPDLIASFGLTVRLMTADSFALEQYLDRTGVVTGVPTPGTNSCGIVGFGR